MIKYILVAILSNTQPFSQEFQTMQACHSAESVILNAQNQPDRTWIICTIDDPEHPTYTNRGDDSRTNKDPLNNESPSTDDSTKIDTTHTDDLPIHQSDDLSLPKN